MTTVTVPADLLQLDRDCYPDQPLNQQQWAKVLTRDDWRCWAQLDEDGLRVGYLVAQVVVEGGYECVKVKRLGVAPDQRRKGIAKGLLEQLEEHNCEVELRETNLAALTLARATGFRTVGLDRGRFSDCDGVLLWREGKE